MAGSPWKCHTWSLVLLRESEKRKRRRASLSFGLSSWTAGSARSRTWQSTNLARDATSVLGDCERLVSFLFHVSFNQTLSDGFETRSIVQEENGKPMELIYPNNSHRKKTAAFVSA